MELVYLWVEDYKNIQKQGFNFSPKFNCHYDVDSNELTIDENNDYIENFFGENINVTAIVGKNGSGKSNLLELIADLEHWATRSTKLFCITIDKGIHKLYHLNFDTDIICTPKMVQEEINRGEKDKNSSMAITEIGISFSYLTLSPFLHNINSFYSCGSNMDFLSIYNYNENFNNTTFNFDSFFLSMIMKIPNILKTDYVRDLFNVNGIPKYIVFKFDMKIINFLPNEVDIVMKSSLKKEKLKNEFVYQIPVNDMDSFNKLVKLYKKVEEKKTNISQELSNLNKELKNKESKKTMPEIGGTKDIAEKINLAKNIGIRSFESKISKLEEEYSSIGKIEFFFANEMDSNKEFNFSTGELILLFYIEKLTEIKEKKKDITILIDESELYLHPDWQKKFISFVCKLFKDNEYKRQVIISSHSPFILSDIPKKNVIFMKDGMLDQGIKHNQTFGANIHTLLSDSFFMDDGLMGEFAKNKIDEIIKNLNNKDYDPERKEKENILLVIKSIGEPFLKNKILDMYYKKFNDVHLIEARKKELLEEQAKIETELKRYD